LGSPPVTGGCFPVTPGGGAARGARPPAPDLEAIVL